MGPHDAVQIRRYINYEIDRLEIRYKLRSITTDNGANIKSATQNNDFGVRIGCHCHNIKLIISQDLGLWKKKSVLRKSVTTFLIVFCVCSIIFQFFSSRMWLNETTSSDEEEEPMIYSEEIQITKCMAESDALNTNVLLEEDATSEAESVTEDSSDEENISSEEQEQQQAQEKLNDIVDEQIFEDTITNDTPPGKIVFGMHLLLCRIRCLIILIRKCYLIKEYVRRQAKADKTIRSGELVVDFHIRWNTTCVMLTKFIEHRRIIVDIINTPGKITNLKRSKCDCLMSLTLCPQHWEWIIILKKNT
ncbi:unnamed protein product [Rotaria sp. Silwood1]|nr:unnamed protein product [Rotaria sp. Silwood1]